MVDALSRQESSPKSLLFAISFPMPTVFQELQQYYSIVDGFHIIQ